MSYGALLRDECRIVRRNKGAYNNTTGKYDAREEEEIYNGLCYVSQRYTIGGTPRRQQIGEEAVIVRQPWIFLPIDAEGIKVEDVVIITKCPDPDLVDMEASIRDVAAQGRPGRPPKARWVIVEDIREGVPAIP